MTSTASASVDFWPITRSGTFCHFVLPMSLSRWSMTVWRRQEDFGHPLLLAALIQSFRLDWIHEGMTPLPQLIFPSSPDFFPQLPSPFSCSPGLSKPASSTPGNDRTRDVPSPSSPYIVSWDSPAVVAALRGREGGSKGRLPVLAAYLAWSLHGRIASCRWMGGLGGTGEGFWVLARLGCGCSQTRDEAPNSFIFGGYFSDKKKLDDPGSLESGLLQCWLKHLCWRLLEHFKHIVTRPRAMVAMWIGCPVFILPPVVMVDGWCSDFGSPLMDMFVSASLRNNTDRNTANTRLSTHYDSLLHTVCWNSILHNPRASSTTAVDFWWCGGWWHQIHRQIMVPDCLRLPCLSLAAGVQLHCRRQAMFLERQETG